jgi:hypothetical protein
MLLIWDSSFYMTGKIKIRSFIRLQNTCIFIFVFKKIANLLNECYNYSTLSSSRGMLSSALSILMVMVSMNF